MRISENNIIPLATSIAVTEDDSGQDSDNIISFDFSTNYAGSGVDTEMEFFITLDQTRRLSYVAIAGHTLVGSVEILIDAVSVGTYTISDNRQSCLFFYFAEQDADNIRIICDKDGATTTVMLVTHIAAGTSFNVPNSGEQAGYSRPWLGTSKTQETSLNAAAAPVAFLQNTKAPKATLSIPNMPKSVAEGEYRDLQDFMMTNAFFILEQDAVPNSSYLCFNAKPKPPKAHSSTRELVNCSVSFNAYTGV